MTGTQLLIVVGILLAVLCATLVSVKGRLQSMRHAAKRAEIIRRMLDRWMVQNDIFEVTDEELLNR